MEVFSAKRNKNGLTEQSIKLSLIGFQNFIYYNKINNNLILIYFYTYKLNFRFATTDGSSPFCNLSKIFVC